jgi:hypothetical protein
MTVVWECAYLSVLQNGGNVYVPSELVVSAYSILVVSSSWAAMAVRHTVDC